MSLHPVRSGRFSALRLLGSSAPLLVGVVLLVGPTAAAPVVAAGATAIHDDLVRTSTVTSFSTPTCSSSGLCPSQVTGAYGVASMLGNGTTNGTGQTIVIDDACGDSAIASDLAAFDTAFGLPSANLTVYQPQGAPCSDPYGWGLETALDVEWSHTMAPGASIALLEAKASSNADLFGAWNYSLSKGLGNAISNSWGGGGACSSTVTSLLTTAGRLHVSVLASSGDSGAWGTSKRLAAQYPADCANVTTVGGTTLSLTSGSGYKSEKAWAGSGGGFVPKTKEPSYQTAAKIVDSYAELGKPDVAAVADPSTGVWIYEASVGGWTTVGGTSVACPIWAGFVSDVNSWRASFAYPALGNFNPFLYASVYGVNGTSAHYAADLHDVKTGSNGWSAHSGWDPATGLGSMQGATLAAFLASNRTA